MDFSQYWTFQVAWKKVTLLPVEMMLQCLDEPVGTGSLLLIRANIFSQYLENFQHDNGRRSLRSILQTYSEPCQISTMECFEKTVKGFIFVKLTIVDICQSSEHPSVVNRLTYLLIKLLKTNLKNILLQILLGSFMNTLSHM